MMASHYLGYDQQDDDEFTFLNNALLDTEQDEEKEDEEQKLIEARQNFFLKLEEAALSVLNDSALR